MTVSSFSRSSDLFAQALQGLTRAQRLKAVAHEVLQELIKGKALPAKALRSVMVAQFGGTDAQGVWAWKDVYEAQEVASILFLRKYKAALLRRTPEEIIATLDKLQGFMATQSWRSDVSQQWQQFSTPLALGYCAALAAGITADDQVLEPSAGTGLLAQWGNVFGAPIVLNELEQNRRDLLKETFRNTPIHGLNVEYLHDLLPDTVTPSVIFLNRCSIRPVWCFQQD